MCYRCRFQLALLKPRDGIRGGLQAYVDYMGLYAHLEQDCMLLSIRPDVHLNFVPGDLLQDTLSSGFEQAGRIAEEDVSGMIESLNEIQDARVTNLHSKRRPTHIVHSLQAMERFMRTGVQSDHFFLKRAYSLPERRAIVQNMLQCMRDDPYINIYFLQPQLPEIRNQLTLFEGKGLLLMDAYTSYDLHDDHSEALIALPEFESSFQAFFLDVVLGRLTLTRQESILQLERLVQLEV